VEDAAELAAPARQRLEGAVAEAAVPEVEAVAPGAGEDDAPEEITSPNYDLAGPLLEEFSLAIDPYPRAPGAAFESADGEGEQPDNPFAVLKSLKTGL
jgi:uncharacterized metal-binding protein YceD (DUF177 family)